MIGAVPEALGHTTAAGEAFADSCLWVRLAEPEPDLRAALEDSPVVGELLDDPQPPATVSAGLWTRRKRNVPLVGDLDSHRARFELNPQRDRSDAVHYRVGN